MASAPAGAPEVRFEDQQQINRFSSLNRTMHELDDDVAKVAKQLEDLADASDELLLADDDEKVNYKMGECYAELEKDDVETLLEEETEVVEGEKKKLEDKIAGIKTELAELKVALYGRFGKTINLDE